MTSFHLLIASPDGNLFDDDAVAISLRGIEGDLAIMSGHVPFTTSVKECDVYVTLPDESERIGHTDGGLLTVSEDKVNLLSGSFVWEKYE
ncbi:MAG: hypothetical protein K5761_06855 [Clostridiales bacterium]|nr:hypothetical protein [Clostridiales bacterium]